MCVGGSYQTPENGPQTTIFLAKLFLNESMITPANNFQHIFFIISKKNTIFNPQSNGPRGRKIEL